jgi:hypothetical protein
MVAVAKLQLVSNAKEISASHQNFVREVCEIRGDKELVRDLLRRTKYWVYEPVKKTFSPSKFSGYVAMDFPSYKMARGGHSSGTKFDGGVTQRAIAQILGDYQPDANLERALQEWAHESFPIEAMDVVDDVLADIDENKWRFVRLPAGAAGGLAALAGGWEGSNELVEAVLDLRRSTGRAAPEME